MTVRRSSLWAAMGLLVLVGSPAMAADDGYQDVVSSVATAVGLMKADPTPEIDYRERAPLVLPPKMDLPVPAVQAARPASWPTDPDVARRRREAVVARAPAENAMGSHGEMASKDELMKGRSEARPEIAQRTSTCGLNGNARNCLIVSPDALKAESEHYDQSNPDTSRADVEAGVEPDRVYLTQPPKGYMKTTKTVKAEKAAPRIYHDEANPNAALIYRPKDDE